MLKRVKGKKLSRIKDKRDQLIKTLANSLIFHEKIETTLVKGKVVSSFVEKLVSYAKRGTLHDRRLILKKISNEIATKKLMDVFGPKYKERQGGYTRVTKTEPRHGDNAPQVLVEFV